MITIIDYGVGNLNSIRNMLKRQGIPSVISSAREDIKQASKIILPGVGAFDSAMTKINSLQLDGILKEKAAEGIPFLGICLGAQLLLEGSEEGNLKGLGLIKGWCRKFDQLAIAPLKVPHMGWSEITINGPHPLLPSETVSRFYFVHSYYLACDNEENVFAKAFYGHEFACGIMNRNIFGVQFHPEKSHRFGAQLLTNFASLTL
jgi:imidazole glycerol-phosphate synthase subunit HisH